jgi:heavy metal sensor kinase
MTRWWRSHSVRVQLTLWYTGVMIVVLGVYAFLVYGSVRRSVSNALDQRLRGDFRWAAAMVGQEPDGTFTGPDLEIASGDEDSPWLQVWSDDGRVLYRTFEAMRRPIVESNVLAQSADDRVVSLATETGPVRVLSRRGRVAGQPVVIQVARWEAPMRQELRELALILVFGLPLAVGAAGLGGYTLAKRALSPVERMTDRARTITAERLSDRLPVHNPENEMGRLATVFNETLGRLELSFQQMRRFTADVSHELRTPLTAIRSVGEVGLRDRRSESEYRGIIGSMLEEADRLAGLVDRLLTLSRAETGQEPLSAESVDLRRLAEDVVSHLGVLAEEKGQVVVVEAQGNPHARGDRLVLRQALINLLDNAIKFTPPGGNVRIRVSESGGRASLEVSDSGPGIPLDAQPYVFDRFYRADNDAARETGGTGLGLSIAKWAVEANGGQLRLTQSGPAGSTFQIALSGALPEHQRAAG